LNFLCIIIYYAGVQLADANSTHKNYSAPWPRYSTDLDCRFVESTATSFPPGILGSHIYPVV